MLTDNIYGVFQLKNFLNKPVLGHGPDTSNFIEGSQKIINSKYTGTMPFYSQSSS